MAQDKLLDAQQMLDSITGPGHSRLVGGGPPGSPALTPDGGEFSDYITVSVSAPTGTVYVSVTEQYPSTADAPMLSRSPSPQAPRMFPPLPSATTGLSVR